MSIGKVHIKVVSVNNALEKYWTAKINWKIKLSWAGLSTANADISAAFGANLYQNPIIFWKEKLSTERIKLAVSHFNSPWYG